MSGRITISTVYTARGLARSEAVITHDGLNLHQVIRDPYLDIVKQKALAKLAQWDERWRLKQEADRKRQIRDERAKSVEQKKQLALEKTTAAKEFQNGLQDLLIHTLGVDDAINWESLKDLKKFPTPKPQKPTPPAPPAKHRTPREPRQTDEEFRPHIGFFDQFSRSRRTIKEQQAQEQFRDAHKKWSREKERLEKEHENNLRKYSDEISSLQTKYEGEVKAWEKGRNKYLVEQKERNGAIDARKERYLSGDVDALAEYCDLVLTRSQYPESFPQQFDLDYNPLNKLLVIDYHLPGPSQIPSLREVQYIQTRDEFKESFITEAQRNKLYDSIVYQISLRTAHELYEADKVNGIASIVFNGYVNTVDLSTGRDVTGFIISLQTTKEEFSQINLKNIEPVACFRQLKGVGSARLHRFTPVAPLVKINKEDSRFVEARPIVDNLNEGQNIAAIDWEDFEHLIRELFEKEFAKSGGEVKVTRASRDGGIDAVVFDPDPIRGGKLVIQAKRYTNTVGVSAVRDLYGTIINEGANKGILVTTSQYGPDAYNFAKGKPIVLLTGGNLLHLLENHGYRVRIDLSEAKKLLGENVS